MSNTEDIPTITEAELDLYCTNNFNLTNEMKHWMTEKGITLDSGYIKIILKNNDGTNSNEFEMCTDEKDFGTLRYRNKEVSKETSMEPLSFLGSLIKESESRSKKFAEKGIKRPIVKFGPWQNPESKK